MFLMLSSVDIPGRPALCLKENEGAVDLGEKGVGAGRVGVGAGRVRGRGGCGPDVMYGSNKKEEEKVLFLQKGNVAMPNQSGNHTQMGSD